MLCKMQRPVILLMWSNVPRLKSVNRCYDLFVKPSHAASILWTYSATETKMLAVRDFLLSKKFP